jgi:cytochrome c
MNSAAAYDYSPALRNSAVRWDEASLNVWLADPEKFIPGQRMGYAVSDARDRGDLIAYLRSVSQP